MIKRFNSGLLFVAIGLLIPASSIRAVGPGNGYADDMLLDREGREDINGHPFQEWVKVIKYDTTPADNLTGKNQEINSYMVATFREKNRELLIWEYRKTLKKNIFKLGYMPGNSSLDSYDFIPYLIMFPARNDRDLELMMYLSLFRCDFSFLDYRAMALYASGDYGRRLIQDMLTPKAPGRYPPSVLASFQESYIIQQIAAVKLMSAGAIQASRLEEKIKQIRAGDSFAALSLRNYFPPEQVINILLDHHLVTPEKTGPLYQLVAAAPKIDDQQATRLLPYLSVATCDRRDPKLRSYSDDIDHFYHENNDQLCNIAGKNPIIDGHLRRILVDFARHAEHREAIPVVALLHSGSNDDLFLAWRIVLRKPDAVAMLRNYAAIFGSAEDAFARWQCLEAMLEKNAGRQDNDMGMPHLRQARLESYRRQWVQLAIFLLEQPGNLTAAHARQILHACEKYPDAVPLYFNSALAAKSFSGQYAELVEERYVADSAAVPASRYLVGAFPFDSLSESVQKRLMEYYLSTVLQSSSNGRKPEIIPLLNIRRPQLQQEICRRLFRAYASDNNSLLYRRVLNYGGTAFVPELLRLARESDPEDTVTALRLIADLSLYARKFAPELIKLADAPETDFTVRIAAMITLAEIDAVESIPMIEKYTQNQNKMVAKAACQALVLLKPIASVDDLPKNVTLFPEIQQALETLKP